MASNSSWRWRVKQRVTSASSLLVFTLGSLATTPVPEHGASRRILSNPFITCNTHDTFICIVLLEFYSVTIISRDLDLQFEHTSHFRKFIHQGTSNMPHINIFTFSIHLPLLTRLWWVNNFISGVLEWNMKESCTNFLFIFHYPSLLYFTTSTLSPTCTKFMGSVQKERPMLLLYWHVFGLMCFADKIQLTHQSSFIIRGPPQTTYRTMTCAVLIMQSLFEHGVFMDVIM